MFLVFDPHSFVDVITNSSTVIYTYHGQDTIQSFKELVNEFLVSVGRPDLTVDDLFYYDIFPDLDDVLAYKDGFVPTIENYRKIAESGEKPEWLQELFDISIGSGLNIQTRLYVFPKSTQYKDLATKFIDFLDSPQHEADFS